MQFKVPQDVLRPDKIVGFLTLRQLVIAIIGGGTAYALYMVLNKQYFIEIWLPPVVFITLITIAFAFIKFHEIVFEKLILLFIEYNFLPRARGWKKMSGDTVLSVFSTQSGQVKKEQSASRTLYTPDSRRKKLEEISKIVDAPITKDKHG